MMKNLLVWISVLLMLIIGMASCDSDDVTGRSELIGTWKFVMALNLPAGHKGPSPHTIELKETDSLLNYMKRTGGTITYTFENSDGEVQHWYTIPQNDSTNNTGYPLLCIQFVSTNYPGEKYAYEIEEGYLKMHNIAFKNPDIYVYRRIR